MLAEQMLKPVNDMMSKMMQMFKKPVDLGIGAPEDALGIVPRLPHCIFVTSCPASSPSVFL